MGWKFNLIYLPSSSNRVVRLFINFNMKYNIPEMHVAMNNPFISNTKTPLRYLDCMVILGICNLNELKHVNSPLLDLETVFHDPTRIHDGSSHQMLNAQKIFQS